MLAHTESLGQVTDNVKVLTTAVADLQGMDPCPTPTAEEPSTSASGTDDPANSPWVAWRALEPFEGIGINVTTKSVYLDQEIASRYSGGGLDPAATFEKKLLIETEFPTMDAAMADLCAGLSDVRMWPLGAGLHGVWQDTAYPLGNSITCPAS